MCVMLYIFSHDVSYEPIPVRRRITNANPVTSVLSNQVQLNYVRVCIGLKLDSILSVLKHVILLDQITDRAVL